MARSARWLIVPVGIVAVLIAALIWWLNRPQPDIPLELPPSYQELRVAIDATNPPFAAYTDQAGFFGAEVELARAVGDFFGVPVRLVNISFDGLYDALISRQVDVVIATLQPDMARTRDVRYTQQYFNAGLLLIAPADSAIRAMSDISGQRIAYEFGGDADLELRRWSRRIPPFDLQPYELPVYALDALRLGAADAALVDAITTRIYLNDHPDWQPQQVEVTLAPYVMAVHYDDRLLANLLNRLLTRFIDDGTLTRILNNWF